MLSINGKWNLFSTYNSYTSLFKINLFYFKKLILYRQLKKCGTQPWQELEEHLQKKQKQKNDCPGPGVLEHHSSAVGLLALRQMSPKEVYTGSTTGRVTGR